MRLIVITICLCFLLLGFSNTENFKKKEKAPPGTVRLNDSLFIDKYEATNLSWREFIYWLKNISQDSIYCNQVYPDTTVWLNHYLRLNDSSFYTNIPFKDYYFTHPSHNEYPVVGITYEQANAYCNWRSDRVNELSLKKPKKIHFLKKDTSTAYLQ